MINNYNLSLKLFLVSLIWLTTITNGAAQSPDADNIEHIALNKTISNFNTAIGRQSLLYNGPEYRFYPNSIKGNAYFNEINTWQTGIVNYDGFYYENVQLMYDVNRDIAVVQLYNGYSMLSLLPEKLESFTMRDEYFFNVRRDSVNQSLAPGIYHLLYNGNTRVLAKQEKSIQPSPSSTAYYFRLSKSFFIKKNNIWHRITSESGALSILKEKKKELKQYLKKNNIKFRKTPETAMMAIATEYDRLTNQQ